MYEVPAKAPNQAIKRNLRQFPGNFMFSFTPIEWHTMRSQIVTASEDLITSRSQIVTLKTGRSQHSKYLQYAFTEQGVVMLSIVLNSEKAISMNIAIMCAFVEIRKVLLQQTDMKEQLRLIQAQRNEHDTQLNQIYDSIENLLDEKTAQRKWGEWE